MVQNFFVQIVMFWYVCHLNSLCSFASFVYTISCPNTVAVDVDIHTLCPFAGQLLSVGWLDDQVLNEEQHHSALRNEYNFDHPDAFDIPLLVATLRRLKDGKHIDVPVYNFSTHAREPQMVFIIACLCMMCFHWCLFCGLSMLCVIQMVLSPV